MSLDIDIRDDFAEVGKIFDLIAVKFAGSSARFAINRTLLTLRKESIQMIDEKLKLKPRTLREKYISLQKAKGSRLGDLFGVISFSGKPIPLIEFMKGNTEPAPQKGIPVQRRRKVRVEITPGKRFVVPHAFVQRVHSTQIFKRNKSKGFHKQGIRSVGNLVMTRGIGTQLQAIGQQRFRELFLADLKARIDGVIPNASKE